MTTTNLIQQFFRQVDQQQPAATSLKPGQIFYGKITKLFPNQMAEVQVGEQRMVAQLETPLSSNERYWFQVQPSDGKVHLKVLANGTDKNISSMPNTPEEMLARLSLPQSKEMTTLVRFLMKEQLPLTREMLTVASEWLKQVDNLPNALQTIKQVISQQLPFTKDVLSAFLSMRDPQPLNSLINNLQQLLSSGEQTNTTTKLLSLLEQLGSSVKNNVTEQVFKSLVEKWLSTNENEQKAAFRLLQSIGLISNKETEQGAYNRLLQTLPKQLDSMRIPLSNEARSQVQLLQQLSVALQSNDKQSTIILLSRLLNTNDSTTLQSIVNGGYDKITEHAVRSVLQSILSEVSTKSSQNMTTREYSQLNDQLVKLLTNENNEFSQLKTRLGNIIEATQMPKASLTNVNNAQLTRQEQLIIQSIQQQIDEQLPKWENKNFTARAMNNIIKSLGLNYEANIGSNKQDINADALKPLLLKYLSEQHPQSSRMAAESVLSRLTGMQLLSQESGPIQQVLMQLPVQMWNKTVDISMQWSGRKTADDKIDPNYCRVLFYLELEHIKETVIDLQVQNKVMNITIFNDRQDLKVISEPFTEQLKANLENGYYKLSALTFKRFKEEKAVAVNPLSFHVDNNYTGVDFRI